MADDIREEDPDWDAYIEADNDAEVICSPDVRMAAPEQKKKFMELVKRIREHGLDEALPEVKMDDE